MAEYTKTSDGKLEVTKTISNVIVNQYDINFLMKQRETILEQKNREIALRDAELAEIDLLISKCEELNIGTK